VTDTGSSLASFTVVAGVIRDSSGRVLLARRPAGRHMAGLWEFPGGKVADGEAPAAALERELAEELDLEVTVGEPLTFAVHEEAGLRILLLFYEAAISSGEPRPREGQEIAWVSPADLRRYPTPPADAGLVERLAAALGP
jgi:8-oxo-dGTP diphosphatase